MARYVVVLDPDPDAAPRIGFDESRAPVSCVGPVPDDSTPVPVFGVHCVAYACLFLLAFQLTLLMSAPSVQRLLDAVFAFVGLYAVVARVDASLILIAIHCVYIVPSVAIAVCTGDFRKTHDVIRVGVLVASAFVNIFAISRIMQGLEALTEGEQSRDVAR